MDVDFSRNEFSLMDEKPSDAFGVNVRNADAGIKPIDEKAEAPAWLRLLPSEIATGIALMSYFAFMLAAADLNSSIPLLLVGAAAFVGLSVVGEMFDVRIKYISAGVTIVALEVLAIVMRQYVGGGLGSIMNMVYEASENAQAYVYNKFNISEAIEEGSGPAVKIAVIWVSILAAAIASMAPAGARRGIGIGVAAFAMIAFAYYGLIPAALIVAIAIAAVLFVLTRGGALAALPVLLATLLVFGAVLLIGPGESLTISRIDENIRDRLALRSAYLETDISSDYPDMSDETREDQPDPGPAGEFMAEHKWIVPLLILFLVAVAIAAIVAFLYKRYAERRDANREGLDSEDPRTAIVAMFPYAVKWLGAANVNVFGKTFASLIKPLRQDVSEQYANYFKSMYVLWREAAYSDHEMEEEKRIAMNDFLEDTKEMVQRDMKLKDKVWAALKYAL